MIKRTHHANPVSARALAGLRAAALACAGAAALALPATAAADGTSLSVAAGSAGLGPFVPGVAQTYSTTVTATVSASDPGAVLSIADVDTVAPGHLANGSLALRQALTARATSAVGAGATGYEPIGGTGAPLALLTYPVAVSDDVASIAFRQSIDADEPLATGVYGKTLLLTLTAGTP